MKNIILQVKVHHSYLKPRAHPDACASLLSSFHRLVKMDLGFTTPSELLDANELSREISRKQ